MTMLDRTTPPPLHDLEMMAIPEPKRYTLDNGINMVVLDGGCDEMTKIMAVLDGGVAEYAKKYLPRVAALSLREGTATKSGSDVADIIDYAGAWLNGTIHAHHLSQSLVSLNSRLPDVLPVFAETLSAPSFPERQTHAIAEMLASQMQVELEKVRYHATLAIDRIVKGPDHPLIDNPDIAEILALDATEIRDSYRRAFNPAHLTLYVSGRITPQIEESIGRTFSPLTAAGPGLEPLYVPFAFTEGKTVEVHRPEAIQSAVSMALPAIPRNHPDYITLRIAVMALGGYFGSRLMANIREDKGYTYGITAALMGQAEGSFVRIDSECDPRYTDALIAEVVSELKGMTTRPLTPEELDRVKRHYMTTLTAQLDSPFSMMDVYSTQQLSATPPDYYTRQQQVLTSITPADIARVAALYLDPSRLSTAKVVK